MKKTKEQNIRPALPGLQAGIQASWRDIRVALSPSLKTFSFLEKAGLLLLSIGLLGFFPALILSPQKPGQDLSHLEMFYYEEDFEQGEVNAWASYPPSQDTAYDPYLYPGRIRPEESGKCLVIKAEPPWNEDQLLGAVKLLDFLLEPSFFLRFRYYLKTVDPGREMSIHLPLSDGRRLVHRIANPVTNQWQEMRLTWADLQAQGLISLSEKELRVTALAIAAFVPKADPTMPIYLGLDDIQIRAQKEKEFQFLEPRVATLSEWKECIPLRHYRQGEKLRLRGSLDFSPGEVSLTISHFIDRNNIFYRTSLRPSHQGLWTAEIPLRRARFPAGLYIGTVAARTKKTVLTQTELVIFVEDPTEKSGHPRYFAIAGDAEKFRHRILSPRFRPVLERFLSRAKSYRDQLVLDTIVFDLDQFPVENWVASLPAWYVDRLMAFREALMTNAVAYLSGQDEAAGPFAKALLLRLSSWPSWNHPWMEARGFHTYYPVGEFAEAFALAYDALYELLSPEDRSAIRAGLFRNYIEPAYRTYVEDNQVTSNSSNWISHIAGGALVALAILAGDDPSSLADQEPWLSGFLLKIDRYIRTVFGADGSYGEGFRYFNFAMQSLAKALPLLKHVFNIDLTPPLRGAHQETLWTSIVQKNIAFGFGDTESYLKQEARAWWIGGENGPMNNWAWLLELTRDPTLAWLYRSLKEFDTLQEVLHETEDIVAAGPTSLGNVRFFPDVGTAVFRSGWETDDFVFVFRSGPFFNHQHMDQGSFYLADHGEIFIEERYDGEHHYYDDPVYRTHAIQPISHNTILLNRNAQSQRVGDPKGFAVGLTDQARLQHWMETSDFAFVAGSLEKVYLENVQKLKRNVLYFKPRMILLVDEIIPGDVDVEVNRLFHTKWKKDIAVGKDRSLIHKDGKSLHLFHLSPEEAINEVLSEPHFLYQFSARPLVERGYLQISARTKGQKLIFADLLTATADGTEPAIQVVPGPSSVSIRSSLTNHRMVAALNLGSEVSLGPWSSDALLLASSSPDEVLVAGGTTLRHAGQLMFESSPPCYGYYGQNEKGIFIRANQDAGTKVSIHLPSRPRYVLINGRKLLHPIYDENRKCLALALPPGPKRVDIATYPKKAPKIKK